MKFRKIRNLTLFLSVTPLLLGVLTLIGWLADIEVFKRLNAATVAMNPASAICFVFLGIELILLNAGGRNPVLRNTGSILALAAGLIGVMKLSDLGFGTSFNPDSALFHQKLLSEPVRPNTMAPNTAFNFMILSLSVLCLRMRAGKYVLAGQILAIAPMLVSLLALTGYAYGIKTLYGIGPYIPMAIGTAIGFIMLCSAVLLTAPYRGFMHYLLNRGPGGLMAGFLLPASILVPFIFGWLSLAGQREGFYDPEFGIAIFVILNMLMLSTLTFVSAKFLFLTDANRRAAEMETRFQAAHDPLTGLLNRRSFMAHLQNRIEAARRHTDSQHAYAVLFIDIDAFKKINDVMGHAAGDQCLSDFANLLRSCTRSSDIIARLGGDEFTIFLDRIRNGNDAVLCAERILGVVPSVFSNNGKSLPFGVSIGIAVGARGAVNSEELLKLADSALYEAKTSGKGRYKIVYCN